MIPTENVTNHVLQRNLKCFEKLTHAQDHSYTVTFSCHAMRKRKLEHLLTAGMIEEKCSWGKQQEKMLDRQIKRLNEGCVKIAPRVMKGRDAWNGLPTLPSKQNLFTLTSVYDF